MEKIPFDCFLEPGRLEGKNKPDFLMKIAFNQWEDGPWGLDVRLARYDRTLAAYSYTRSGMRMNIVELRSLCEQMPQILLSMKAQTLFPFQLELLEKFAKGIYKMHRKEGGITDMIEHAHEAMSEGTNHEMKRAYEKIHAKEQGRMPGSFDVRTFFCTYRRFFESLTAAYAVRQLAKKHLPEEIRENEYGLGFSSRGPVDGLTEKFEQLTDHDGSFPKRKYSSIFEDDDEDDRSTRASVSETDGRKLRKKEKSRTPLSSDDENEDTVSRSIIPSPSCSFSPEASSDNETASSSAPGFYKSLNKGKIRPERRSSTPLSRSAEKRDEDDQDGTAEQAAAAASRGSALAAAAAANIATQVFKGKQSVKSAKKSAAAKKAAATRAANAAAAAAAQAQMTADEKLMPPPSSSSASQGKRQSSRHTKKQPPPTIVLDGSDEDEDEPLSTRASRVTSGDEDGAEEDEKMTEAEKDRQRRYREQVQQDLEDGMGTQRPDWDFE